MRVYDPRLRLNFLKQLIAFESGKKKVEERKWQGGGREKRNRKGESCGHIQMSSSLSDPSAPWLLPPRLYGIG
jgi:hypothetical protein